MFGRGVVEKVDSGVGENIGKGVELEFRSKVILINMSKVKPM